MKFIRAVTIWGHQARVEKKRLDKIDVETLKIGNKKGWYMCFHPLLLKVL